jgi:hypothetical protein
MGFRNAMAGGQLAPGQPNRRLFDLRETRVKRRTKRGEQGKLDGVLTTDTDEEEQTDSAANRGGGQLGLIPATTFQRTSGGGEEFPGRGSSTRSS